MRPRKRLGPKISMWETPRLSRKNPKRRGPMKERKKKGGEHLQGGSKPKSMQRAGNDGF